MDNKKVNQVSAGLLKDPLSKKWRAEYAKLSKEEREDVKFIIENSMMGTDRPGKEFMDFWKYTDEVD